MQNELVRQTGNLRDAIDRFIQENIVPAAGVISSGPPANIYDSGATLTVHVALPGVISETLDVTASGNTLRIRGTYSHETPPGVKALRQDLPHGKFEKSVALPVAIETEGATAHYEDGVLTLSLPKSVRAAPRPIVVQPAGKSDKSHPASGSAITKPPASRSAATRQPQASPMLDKARDEVDLAADQSFPASDPPPSQPGSV